MIFGKNIDPSCELCEFGFFNEETCKVKCNKRRGKEFDLFHKCRKFSFDPLKKSPRKKPKLHEHSAEEFAL